MSDHSFNEKAPKDGAYVEGSYDHERDSLAETPHLKRQLKNRHSMCSHPQSHAIH